MRALELARDNDVDWIGRRDAALLTLLYGAGLRISEALSLKRGDVPLGDTLTILGKGRKERSVPVLPLRGQRDCRLCRQDLLHPPRPPRRCFCPAAAGR